MKILQFSAENFMRLSVVDITPKGHLVEITGKNRQGKTSVLNAIWAAIAGAEHLQTVPIRKGADKATLMLKLGGDKTEMIVTRTIRNKKEADGFTTTLTVENADGFRAPKPQEMLDGLISALTLDPLALLRMSAEKQVEQIRRLNPELDFIELNAANKVDYAKRTEVNRDAKRARAAADAVQVPDSIDATTEAVDEAALTKELADAGKNNTALQTETTRRARVAAEIEKAPATIAGMEKNTNDLIKGNQDRTAADVARVEAEIAHLEEAIERARFNIVTINKEAENMQNHIAATCMSGIADVRKRAEELQDSLDTADPIPEPIDTDALTAKITEARHTNAAIRLREQRAALVAEAERHEAASKALTAAMDARDKQKTDLIAAADLPVEGLGITEDGLTLNGLPFDQASDAEQLEAAVAIAMAGNPKLKVIRIRDGSLLDSDAMAQLAKIAEAKDMQCWVEVVSNDGKTGFVLEDGTVTSTPESRAAQPDLLAETKTA